MGRKRVLIVDDEMDMRIFVSTLLETNGYKPIIANNGEEGIQKAREFKPAAIILDVLMPKSGGLQMYREVKTDDELKGIPVIYNSMRMLNSYKGQAVPEPEAYIEKPPEIEELLKAVKQCTDSHD